MKSNDKIKRLEAFKALLGQWVGRHSRADSLAKAMEVRSQINQDKAVVRQIVIENDCFKVVTISPPPIVGGLIMRNVDPFDRIFDPPYHQSLIPLVLDMIDETIGVLRAAPGDLAPQEAIAEPTITEATVRGYAFVAMPMDPNDARLGDVLDAIKEAASRCDIVAERVDDVISNDRITDRILESIRKAEFVIADLTNAKPNVYFEAGYAHGFGKTPIYISADGTKPEFDVKDYPVIFFKNLRELKAELERRLRALAAKRGPANKALQRTGRRPARR